MRSIYQSETGFAKPSIPAGETVLLTNPYTTQLFTLIAGDKITIKKYDAFILRQVPVYYIFLWINLVYVLVGLSRPHDDLRVKDVVICVRGPIPGFAVMTTYVTSELVGRL